jgi:hypothetical protein
MIRSIPMKWCNAAAVAVVFGSAVFAFAGGQEKDAKHTDGPTTKPVNKFCAVQGEPHEVVADGGTYEYKSKTYGFCCEDCVAEFKKEPEKYASKAK